MKYIPEKEMVEEVTDGVFLTVSTIEKRTSNFFASDLRLLVPLSSPVFA